MARIPHRVRPEVPLSRQGQTYLNVPRNPGAFGVGVGSAIAGIGTALAPLGQALQERQEKTDRFGALRSFSSFMTEAQTALTEAKRNTDPGTANFPAIADATFRNVESKFLSQLPPDLQEEFSARTGQVKSRLMIDALDFQYQQQDQFFNAGISDAYEEAKLAVSRSPEEYEEWLANVFETIDTADIPHTQKLAKQREMQAGLASVLYLREAEAVEKGFMRSDGTAEGMAAALLRDFESFAPSAAWDVNAFRAGYGSDTVTLEDGSVVLVEQGTQVTQAQAEADLRRRIPEFRNTVVKQVGLDNWARLPQNVQAALISVAYNYGSLPKTIEGAIRNMDAAPQIPKVEGSVSSYYSEGDLRNDRFPDATMTPEAVYLLDRVTEGMGKKLKVTSAFRDDKHNRKVGGAETSQHLEGNAIDIDTGGMSQDEQARLVATAAANGATGFGYYKGHIHIDSRPTDQVVKWGDRPKWFDEAIVFGGTQMGGNFEGVAQAVENLGANPGRRAREAEVIRGRGLSNMGQDDLDADPRFASIPYESRLALREDARLGATQARNAEIKARKEAKDQAINSFLIGVDDGTEGFASFEALKQQGLFNDYGDRSKAQKALEEKYGDLMKMRAAQAKDNNPRSIWSPGLKEDRDQQNLLLDKDRLLQADPKYVTDSLVPAVGRRGDIPTDAVAILEGMFSTGNRENMLFALDALGQMQDVDGRAFDRRVPDKLAAAVEFWRSHKDFYNEEEIINRLRGPQTQQERQARETLAQQGNELLTTGDVEPAQAVIDHFSGIFSGTPEVGGAQNVAHALPMLQQEANDLFIEEFSRFGDEDKALEATVKRMSRVWGTSRVGGVNVLMKYPPEKIYPDFPKDSGDHSWVGEEMRREFNLRSTHKIQLVSDDQTKAEVQAYSRGELDHLPTYIPLVKDENGGLFVPQFEVEAGIGRESDLASRYAPEFPTRLRVLDNLEFDSRVKAHEFNEFEREFEQARLHESFTGIPIPEDMLEEREAWMRFWEQRRGEEDVARGTSLAVGERQEAREVIGEAFGGPQAEVRQRIEEVTEGVPRGERVRATAQWVVKSLVGDKGGNRPPEETARELLKHMLSTLGATPSEGVERGPSETSERLRSDARFLLESLGVTGVNRMNPDERVAVAREMVRELLRELGAE